MISFNRYIFITSGVGAGAGVRARELILRIITDSSLVPAGAVIEFTNLDAIGTYFGTTSKEYLRASQYLSFVSKSISKPRKISYGRYAASALPPEVTGDTSLKNLATLKGATSATLTVEVDGVPSKTGIMDLSAITSFEAAAVVIQSAIRAISSVPQLVAANVSYVANTNQFKMLGSSAGAGSIKIVSTGLGDDLSTWIGWGKGAVFSVGIPKDDGSTVMARTAGISTNFGSFLFQLTVPPSMVDITSSAAWNDAQNNKFLYCVPCQQFKAPDVFTAIKGYSGVGVTIISNSTNDFSEQCAAEILAATNYSLVNSTQNYMYYQFPKRQATITNDTDADSMDKWRTNYIGATEQAGQILEFFQRGVLMGGPTAAVDINVYANEMWFKDNIGVNLMSMFLNSPRVSVNNKGRGQILTTLQTSIDAAKNNGTISPGKPLNTDQKGFITTITNDPEAWRQVQNIGVYVSVDFQSSVTVDGRTEWAAVYLIVYSKDDQVRSINGTNTLI